MAKKALGKGLGALLPADVVDVADAPETEPAAGRRKSRLYNFEDRVRLLGRVTEIELDQIKPNPYQPRTNFDEERLAELAESIKQLGIIQPITVRTLGNNEFEIISGERRFRACRLAGLKKIPAYVREADLEAMLEMALVENVQRENLNPIEIALGYKRLMDEVGLTQEQVAEKVGKNRTTVTNFLRLLRLPPRVLSNLREGTISAGHARMLVALDHRSKQLDLLDVILRDHLSVRQVEQRVRELQQKTKSKKTDTPKAKSVATPSVDDLQIQKFTDQLRTHLGTQVHIRPKPDGAGKIEIEYYTQDDLERVLEVLLASQSPS